MKLAFLASLLLTAAASDAAADQMTVHDPICKQVTMRVVENTQSRFENYSLANDAVFLANPVSNRIVVGCHSMAMLNVNMSTNSPFPDDTWFYLAARAAEAISPDAHDDIEKAIRECHRDALKESGAPGSGTIRDARLECFAYDEDKISSVYIYLTNPQRLITSVNQ